MIDSQKFNLETREMRRLYLDEGLSLRQIAKRVGITFQAVHNRLRRAGVPLRPMYLRGKSLEGKRIKKEDLERWYLEEGLSIFKTAEILGATFTTVASELDRHGIERRKQGSWTIKYGFLNQLNIGDSVQVERPNGIKPHVKFYMAASTRGMTVSVKRVGADLMKITRKG